MVSNEFGTSLTSKVEVHVYNPNKLNYIILNVQNALILKG